MKLTSKQGDVVTLEPISVRCPNCKGEIPVWQNMGCLCECGRWFTQYDGEKLRLNRMGSIGELKKMLGIED